MKSIFNFRMWLLIFPAQRELPHIIQAEIFLEEKLIEDMTRGCNTNVNMA